MNIAAQQQPLHHVHCPGCPSFTYHHLHRQHPLPQQHVGQHQHVLGLGLSSQDPWPPNCSHLLAYCLHTLESRGLGHAQNPIWALEDLLSILLFILFKQTLHLIFIYSRQLSSTIVRAPKRSTGLSSRMQRQVPIIHSYCFLLERGVC